MIALTDALDSVFLDTDGVAGADTAYVTRGARGLWKFALAGGAWQARGRVVGQLRAGSTARAVAGAVELYATDRANTKRAEDRRHGRDRRRARPRPARRRSLYAPGGARYTGLAFAPGTGFPADATPYPATPPAIYPSATARRHVARRQPEGERRRSRSSTRTRRRPTLTVTARRANPTVLPERQDRDHRHRRTSARSRSTRQAVGTANVTLTVKAGDDDRRASRSPSARPAAPRIRRPLLQRRGRPVGRARRRRRLLPRRSRTRSTPSTCTRRASRARRSRRSAPASRAARRLRGRHPLRRHDRVVGLARQQPLRLGPARAPLPGVPRDHRLRRRRRPRVRRTSYTRLWTQWKAWDAANGHGLGREQAEVRHRDGARACSRTRRTASTSRA